MTPIPLKSLNALDRDAFTETLADIYEHSPWVAQRAYATCPFDSVAALAGQMAQAVDAAARKEQMQLINAHPDLASKWNSVESLTAFSAREQKSSGLTDIDEDTFQRFCGLNKNYRETFGFPFIICVKEHDLHAILNTFELRLGNDSETEFWAALTQVHRIAWHRLQDRIEA